MNDPSAVGASDSFKALGSLRRRSRATNAVTVHGDTLMQPDFFRVKYETKQERTKPLTVTAVSCIGK